MRKLHWEIKAIVKLSGTTIEHEGKVFAVGREEGIIAEGDNELDALTNMKKLVETIIKERLGDSSDFGHDVIVDLGYHY